MSRNKTNTNPFVKQYQSQLEQCTYQKAAQLRGRLRGLVKIKDEKKQQKVLSAIKADIEQAELNYLQRSEQSFHIEYPENLPVAQQRDDIKKAIEDNQVVVVAGETGSGETT